MPTKGKLQATLKTQYGINKNITQSLSTEDCQELLTLLQTKPSTSKVVASFIAKTQELSRNNRSLGLRRKGAEDKVRSLQKEHERLVKEVSEIEDLNKSLLERKNRLMEEKQRIQADNQRLAGGIRTLTTQNDELVGANEKLKKDNKDLKNIVDQIRLRLARDTKTLLEYEDSEIRKALIRILRWTLG
jgi:predicted nuclease with TOPRIM domain